MSFGVFFTSLGRMVGIGEDWRLLEVGLEGGLRMLEEGVGPAVELDG